MNIKRIIISIVPYWVLSFYRSYRRIKRRSRFQGIERPAYYYCVYQGALLAKRLGHDSISVIEFGVAGGNGLLNLEMHAEKINEELGIKIEIYGFDTEE